MKVCFVIDSWFPVYGGGPTHVQEIAKRLVTNHGCKVTILTRKLLGDAGERGDLNESLLDGRLKIIKFGPTTKFNNHVGRVWFLICSFIFLLFSQYDIVNAQAFLPALPSKCAKFFKKFSLVYTVHGTGIHTWNEMNNRIFGKIQRQIENTLLCKIHYDKVVSVSEDFLRYPNVNKDIRIIHNGINVRIDALSQVVKKSSKFTIIFVGRLHPQKGLIYLIDAMRVVVAKLPNSILQIVGSGDLQNKLNKQVSDIGLNKNIFFPGKIFGDALTRAYHSSHVFVLPSLYEGEPLTLLEAWQARLPVVATNVGGIPYIVDNNVDGLLVPPKDPLSLAKAILRCASPDAKILGEHGYQKVKTKFSWDESAQKFYSLFIELCIPKITYDKK